MFHQGVGWGWGGGGGGVTPFPDFAPHANPGSELRKVIGSVNFTSLTGNRTLASRMIGERGNHYTIESIKTDKAKIRLYIQLKTTWSKTVDQTFSQTLHWHGLFFNFQWRRFDTGCSLCWYLPDWTAWWAWRQILCDQVRSWQCHVKGTRDWGEFNVHWWHLCHWMLN